MVESSTTTNEVPAMSSKVTPVAPRKPEPETVTAVPPVCGPLLGARLAITGASASMYSNASGTVSTPPHTTVPMIVTSTKPGVPAGVVAVIDVSLLTVKDAADTPSKSTSVAPVKQVP